MSLIDFCTSWRTQALHRVIASTEQESTQDIDDQMESCIDLARVATDTFIQNTNSVLCSGLSSSPYGNAGIDAENYGSGYGCCRNAFPPS